MIFYHCLLCYFALWRRVRKKYSRLRDWIRKDIAVYRNRASLVNGVTYSIPPPHQWRASWSPSISTYRKACFCSRDVVFRSETISANPFFIFCRKLAFALRMGSCGASASSRRTSILVRGEELSFSEFVTAYTVPSALFRAGINSCENSFMLWIQAALSSQS